MNYRERRIWDCTFAAAFAALGPDREVRADEAMRMADLAVLKVRHLGGPLEGEEEVGCNAFDGDDRGPDLILRFIEAAVRWCDSDRGSAEESEAFNDLVEARGVLPSDFSSANRTGVRYLVDAISFDGGEDGAPFATFASKWGNGVDVEVPPGTKRIRVTVQHPGRKVDDGR